MRRLALAAALVLAVAAGTARAQTFAVVPDAPKVLPSAETPNRHGFIAVPAAPSAPATLPPGHLPELWRRAGAAYGIPWQVLAAINKLESNFGQNMGPSSAGAIGWMQFMPSTWERWGLDANGDGVADPWNAEDAIFAAARYLAAAGGRTDLPRAVFAYNHAQWYVDDVLQLAGVYAQNGGDLAFTAGPLDVDLQAAQRVIASTERLLADAIRLERSLRDRELGLLAEVERADLFSNRLSIQKRAVLAGVQVSRAQREIERLRGELTKEREALDAARQRAQAAAFAPAGGALVAPIEGSGYVFPVGGGPATVSVARTHHDYPAADIVAPSGAPLYALADAIVLRAWAAPEGRCGIGFSLQTGDGLTWTYCHLSYLDPAVVTGAVLGAGTPVGLVGTTGHSSGPHLHLQLQPATSYPQEQPWFQGYAGSAFRWQGEAALQPRTRAVFAVLSREEDDEGDAVERVITFVR